MHQPHNALSQGRAQMLEPRLGAGIIHQLAVFHQRADPIGLPPFGHGTLQVAHHLVHPRGRNQRRAHRFAPRRLFIQHRHIHVAIAGQRQAARNWCGGHHQHIGGRPLGPQFHALRHAKAVLFIDHRQPQVLKLHILLEHRMGADQNLHRAGGQARQLLRPLCALVAPCQQNKAHPGGGGQRFQPRKMLARQNFGGGHHHPLPAGLYCDQQRQKGDQCLARSDIALQQPVHPQR